MPAPRELIERKRWLRSQGWTREQIERRPRSVTWYRPDEKALHDLPCDTYQVERYRSRGCTLVPTDVIKHPSSVELSLRQTWGV